MSVTAVPLKPVNSSTRLWLWLGILLAIALAFGVAWMGTRAAVAVKGTNEQYLAWNKSRSGVKTTSTRGSGGRGRKRGTRGFGSRCCRRSSPWP